MRLRPLVTGDLERIMELEAELFGAGAWSPGMYAEELAAPGRHYVVAEEAGRVVGYAGILLERTAQVMTVGVEAASQGRGIGRALMTDLLDAAAAAGAREVLLEVRADHERPQRLYRSLGFTPLGIRAGYYEREGADAVVMRLDWSRKIGPIGSEVSQT